MPTKLVTEFQATIPMNQMVDGQLAVVIDKPEYGKYTGKVVQRFDNHFVVIGERYGLSWDSGCSLPVRLLQPGELIEIT